LLSVTDRDAARALPPLDLLRLEALAQAASVHDLAIAEARPATAADVERLGSSWARRLGIPERRSATLLRLEPVPGATTALPARAGILGAP
jgi:hypothetical protein